MSQPTSESAPPAYIAYRTILVTVMSLVVLGAGLLLAGVAADVIAAIGSAITDVREQWDELNWQLT